MSTLKATRTENGSKGPDEKGCWLASEHEQCCCNCRNHLKDNFHCTIHTELRASSGDNCICSFRKGWICVGMVFEDPENGRAHSEWPEHSIGCEMYTPIKKAAPQEPSDQGSGTPTGVPSPAVAAP